ncbi:MAG: glycosyltransferase family 1 protein, partial [Chloroflexi bacterium]
LRAALNAVWSRESQENIRRLIREKKPDVAHFHNTFLMVSPAAYYACKEAGVPVVQTLHNYRLICPGALLMRDGRVCEECVGRAVPWPGMVHACWRGSRLQTSVVTAMLTVHRAIKTWTEQVDFYIALTEFARRKFIEGGLPADKIVVKPNFITPDPGMGDHEENYALFVGRLSPEKGVQALLRAWRRLRDVPLKVVGDGPLMKEVQEFVGREGLQEVEVPGRRPRDEVFRLMREARALVFPSEWYETFGMTIAEAFACGLPVIASRLGAMAEIVEEGRTGLLFEPGNPEDLAAKVEWAWSHPEEMAEMGREARREYTQKYTAERNYQILMDIYRRAVLH